jgi:hypothetical protein|tara:strand:+ start:580 stop:942 length:363 start_codon:yes stop_codon:yes gene_type:complete
MEKGITMIKLPPGAHVDEEKLKIRLVRSKLEMDFNVNEGTFPIFGYPLVCYSPDNKNEKSDFWTVMFKSAMKKVKKGEENEIGQLLGAYDSFCEKNDKLEEKFAKGGLFGKDIKNKETIN